MRKSATGSSAMRSTPRWRHAKLEPAPAPTAAGTQPVSGKRLRLYGLDMARALAVIGMVAVHFRPYDSNDGVAGAVLNLGHGRASILFMILAGIGAALLLRPSLRAAKNNAGNTRSGRVYSLRFLWRAVLLLLGGLALQMLDHGVSVILQTYGVLFLIAPLLLRLPQRHLLTSAVGFVLIGPVALVLIHYAMGSGLFEVDLPAFGDTPLEILTALLVTGRYPLMTWMAPFLLGLWLGRGNLTDHRVQLRMVLTGGVLALLGVAGTSALASVAVAPAPLGLNQLASGLAHSNMPLWLIESIGTALLIIGTVLLAERALRTSKPGLRLAAPLITFGQLALSLYVAHLLLIAGVLRPMESPQNSWEGLGLVVGFVLTGLGATLLWQRYFRHGPLESLLRLPEALSARRSIGRQGRTGPLPTTEPVPISGASEKETNHR